MNKLKKYTESIFKNKSLKKYLVPFALIAAAIMIFAVSSPSVQKSNDKTPELALGVLSEQLEKRIRDMCEKVDGVGNAYVMLTLDTSEEYVYAENTEKSENHVKSQFVLSETGGAVELYVVCPKVRGVAVVCDGGDRASVKNVLTELISSALGVPTSNISIAGT